MNRKTRYHSSSSLLVNDLSIVSAFIDSLHDRIRLRVDNRSNPDNVFRDLLSQRHFTTPDSGPRSALLVKRAYCQQRVSLYHARRSGLKKWRVWIVKITNFSQLVHFILALVPGHGF